MAIKPIIPKSQSLLRSTSMVSIMTFFSRILGAARDLVFAYYFGAQPGMDAFLVAFRIPNFMRRLFAEGAFSQAFVPVLAEYQKQRSDVEVRQFLSRMAGALGTVLSLVTICGVLLAPLIVLLFAPGFGIGEYRSILATEMLRLTFPYLMLISLTAMAGAILNTYGYFGIPAVTPIWLNLTLMVAAIVVAPYFHTPVIALAFGVLVAGMIQFLFQLPFLRHRGLLIKPTLVLHDEGIRRVLKLMVPALFGVSIAQLNLMVDSIFASFLKSGSVSWLYFTDRLTDFPLGVFGVAIATVILPHLSRRHAEQSISHFSAALDWGLRLLLLIGVPSGLGLMFFSMPLIATCFAYGHFNVMDVLQTQKSLITLGFGVPAFMMVKVLASGFYARQDIKTPVRVGAMAMLANTGLCALFIYPLAHAGLTLASSLAGYLNCGMLLVLLMKRGFYKPCIGWKRFLGQLLLANTLVSFYLYLVIGDLSGWLSKPILIRLVYLFMHVTIAVILYLLTLSSTGMRWEQFRGRVIEN